MFLIYFFILFF